MTLDQIYASTYLQAYHLTTKEVSLPSMKIMLINSPNEVQIDRKNANYSLFPHMGIVQLATRIKNEYKDRVEIKVLDGGISTTSKIQGEIRSFMPDLTGISVLTPTYNQGLKIAQVAKDGGSQVVLGDEHAIFFPELILKNRNEVDFIVANDSGEAPFSELVKALLDRLPLESVSSLVYRTKNEIKRNSAPKYWLRDQNTIPDLGIIEKDLPIYADKYHEAFGHFHPKKLKVITVNNARGCENGSKRCSYCSIADLTVNTGSPEQFWETVRHYHYYYGINLFFEVYDSFTASPHYITQLIETIPKDIQEKVELGDIEFMVYARALGLIKRGNVEKLRRLGVKRVNIGLDSGDTKMLEAQRKNKTTNETNLEALSLLSDAGMTIHGSYILGALGETEESIQYTVDHIRHTLAYVKFSTIELSRLFPLANSPIWDMLINFESPKFYRDSHEIVNVLQSLGIRIPMALRCQIRDKYIQQDLINSEEIRHDWYRNYTHVEESYVLKQIQEVDELIESQKIKTGKNIG